MELTVEGRAELRALVNSADVPATVGTRAGIGLGRGGRRALVNSADVPATVATRARIVLWRAENRQKQEVAALAGVSRPTVDLWLDRYRAEGGAGLLDRPRGAPPGAGAAAGRAPR